jgi:serine/threonine protein kinase
MTLETGTILNNIYRVVTLLGKGAMGNVYLVERIEDDKKFVVKELFFTEQSGLDPSTAKEIFFREAEFMVNFNHPGLPKTYGIFTEKEFNYLTMDYIEGKTLEEILTASGKPLSEEKAIKWTVKLCEILDYLHNTFKAPVVYRDLKPSNIIITPDDKVKLVDFGIARYYNPYKSTDTFSYGSPGYAAPEQYRGRGQSSPQSDIYGLGVILYQMLTLYDPSVKPFTFPPMKTLNPSVRAGLEKIIRRAIEMESFKRYISVNDFRDGLLKYTGDGLLKYTGDDKISSKKSSNSAMKTFCKIAGLFVFSVCGMLLFFNPVINYKFFDLYDLQKLSYLIFISSIITFFLWHIIKLIIDIKKRTVKLSLLSRVMIILTFASLVIVNFFIVSSDYLNNSLSIILYAFIIWFFIKFYMIQSFLLRASVILLFFVLFFFMTLPDFLRSREIGRLISCESNIKNIATALDMNAADNKGYYPLKLDKLTEATVTDGGYMKTIPICPGSRKIPSYGYIFTSNPHNFTIWCTGVKAHIHVGADGYPQYAPGQGLNGQGLKEK